jgi:hypothetical protein
VRTRRAAADFQALAAEWERETLFLSSTTDIVLHPAYQRIIGLGPAAVPLILGRMRERPGHWFWALRAITGEDPVQPEERGDLAKMARRWLDWGAARGLIHADTAA